MRRILVLAALPLALATAAKAQAISPQTTDFITKAAATDAFERDAGRLAEKRSGNADIRAFAGTMVTAHTNTTDKLRAVLTKDHLPIPTRTTPEPNEAKLLTDLVDAPKGKFDRAYAHSQVVAHQRALALMQNYAANGDNPDLKALAAATAPEVEMHLNMALKLEGQAGGPPKSLTRKED